MNNRREILEDKLEDYSSKVTSLSAYIKELNSTVAKLGTDRTHVEEDLLEAEHNVKFYQTEIGHLQKELAGSPLGKPGSIAKPGLLALALSPIGFLVGAFLGAKLKSRRDTRDTKDN